MVRKVNVDGFTYRIGSTTNILGRPPRLFASNNLVGSGCRFASVYAIRQEDAHYIEEAGTAAGFKGIVWSKRLWIDLDTEEAAQGARRKIEEMGLDHVVYSTGNRGLHIGIARDNRPSHTLPGQDKEWVQANIPGADISLYWHLHLIRLPGTLHEETGRPKKLIYSTQGQALSLNPLQEQKRTNTLGSNETTQRGSIFQEWDIVSKLTEDNTQSRHRQLVKFALTLKEKGLRQDESVWLVHELNKGFTESKEINEVDRIVEWVYSK